MSTLLWIIFRVSNELQERAYVGAGLACDASTLVCQSHLGDAIAGKPAPTKASSHIWPAVFPTGLQLDPGCLQFGVLVERVQRLVATVTGLLEATKRCGHVTAIVLVDPHATVAQGLGRQVRFEDRRRPHRSGQAVFGVVSDSDSFFFACDGEH